MAQIKVIKTGRVSDRWERILLHLQNGLPEVYRCTFPSVDLARKASHSFRDAIKKHSYFRMEIIHRGEVCYVFKTNAVQDVRILDE